MLSGRSSLYIINPRTLIILKNSNLVKFNLLLGLVVHINIIFVFSILYRKYTLSSFLRVSSCTLFLLINFFITLLKNIKFYRSLSYNLWILSTIIIKYSINSSHFLILNKTSALNSLFIKNGGFLIMLCSEVLYASIPMSNNLTQLVY